MSETILLFPSVIIGAKVVLLLLAAISHHVGLKSPNPPPKEKDGVYRGQIFENIVRLLATASQISTNMTLVLECVVLIALNGGTATSHTVFEAVCPHPSLAHSIQMASISAPFILGVTVMVLSAAIRIWCYRTLGSLFTFEVSIKPKHTLITSGPYQYVRHFSYTGCVSMLLGAAITCLVPGSYINECGLMQTPARYFIRSWEVIAVFASLSLWRRVNAEEEGLRKAFGREWEAYCQDVPYQFVPFVY